MDKYTEDNTRTILEKIRILLEPLAKEQGIKIDIIEPKFSDVYMEARLSLELVGKEEVEKEERRKYFLEHCNSIGLSECHWGMEFEFYPLHHKCVIHSIDFHDEENPIVIMDLETLTLYRTSTMFFLNSI